MTTRSSSLLRRCRQGLLTLLTCGSVLSSLLMAGMVGVPLALVSPAVMATCTESGATNLTYNYTAANITQAAPLQFPNTWQCKDGTTKSNSANICYESVFDGTAAKGATTMTYTVGLNDTSNNIPSMTSGTVYGLYTNPVGGTANPLAVTLTVTVPAGQATTMAPGTYIDNNILFEFDEQGNGGACEHNFVPSTSNWDAATVTYSVNYVIPSVCTLVSTSTVNFGNISGSTVVAAGGVPATGAVTVNCTSTTAYTVYLGDGNQRLTGGGNRQMANGTALLPYQLYKDSGYTKIWDATGGTSATGGSGGQNGTGSGVNQSLTVYARIPGGAAVPATIGNYTDTVVVTVTY
ncbi:spore coat U domain-containing protein [Rhodanobacter sp. C03]|uniref:Csu type fimbrial protein n=1 Tax=Rhodanobacter sp. C03 TaxID=1945858 RepID=UPI0009842159|nr:spore coat U domain-containing protein [Rhodanobacter sp. C03]OOG53717.1 hypothetical protein B0E48_15700 [Rhodanobacter sp. C03]